MLSALLSLYFSTLISHTSLGQQINVPKPLHAAAYKEILSVSPMPIQTKEGTPQIQAGSALIMDVNSGVMLWGKEISTRRQIGSITKLMTALVVLEENNTNDIIKISAAASNIEGSRIWIAEGEKITVQDLLYASIIHSANDASYALAEFNSSGSIKKFVEKMNEKGKELGLKNTHFSNPVGFDGPENYSTAEDIAILARYAWRNNFIRHAAGIAKKEIQSLRGTKFKLENTNGLLEKDSRFKGLKTGHTAEAGYSFVGIAETESAYSVMTIVFNSPNRFQESINLIDWVNEHYKW